MMFSEIRTIIGEEKIFKLRIFNLTYRGFGQFGLGSIRVSIADAIEPKPNSESPIG